MEKYDKSLIEVWEWKEKAYQDMKDLSTQDYLEKLKKNTDTFLAGHKLKLKVVSPQKHLQEVN